MSKGQSFAFAEKNNCNLGVNPTYFSFKSYDFHMKFVLSVVDSVERLPHSEDERQAIDEFNEKLVNAGQRLLAVGIDAPSQSAVFDFRNGQAIVAEGPLIESDEIIAGFWVIEVENLDIARALAAEGSKSCNRKIELRPLLG